MASVKVGINGFGRIARVVLRSLESRETSLQVCAINVRNANLDRMVYMLKYDTVFGRFQGEIKAVEDGIEINGKYIKVFSEDKPENINWASVGVEYVIESTGKFRTAEGCAKHFVGGAKKVILSAPGKGDGIPTFVMGVNNETYTSDMTIVSNASCTGRSVFNNIIPSTTGAAKAVGLVVPELKGKLTGMSYRIPSSDVSVVDLTAKLKTPTTYEAICAAVKEASEGSMKGIIEYNNDEIVSSDLRGDYNTSIFDEKAGIMLGDDFVKLVAWYDNEWGYSNKLIDLVAYMAEQDAK